MPKSISQTQFLDKAIKKHGDKFDYSKTFYKNSSSFIIITCPIHGDLELPARAHLLYDCKKCVDERFRKPVESFFRQASEKHGGKYDYSKTKYTNSNSRIIVTCHKHGDFDLRASHHLGGQGCKKCAHELTGEKNSLTQDEFINRSNLVHDDKYNYSKVEYDGINIPVKIICPLHGEFLQTPNTHLNGSGCKECGFESISQKNISNSEDFIESAKIVHGDKYDYSQVDYKLNTTPVKIKCSIHGEFAQSPAAHLRGQGCPICQESTGEKLVSTILEKQEVKFLKQHKFVDCTNKKQGRYCRKLPFDFYIPELNVCIEYDGRQHFEPIIGLGGENAFKNQKIRDKIKTEYCEENGIKLIRIPYTMNKEDIEPYILSELGI